MAHFDHPENLASFDLPEKPTYRDVLRYDEVLEIMAGVTEGPGMYERLWRAACSGLVKNWQSDAVRLSVDALDGESITTAALSVIKWASLVVFSFVQALKDLPKNA